MTPRRIVPAPTRLLAWALALAPLLAAAGCDRTDDAKVPHAPAAAAPTSVPSPKLLADRTAPEPEEFSIKLASLRRLIADQPRAADRATYAAYLVRDDDAAKLVESLAASGAGTAASPAEGPPIVASVDSYKRKGRTIDASTGKPVKVLQVRVAGRPGADSGSDSGSGSAAEVVASWQAGKLAGASYRYRLRKESGAWVVVGRVDEGP
jgi:hypothetical protein